MNHNPKSKEEINQKAKEFTKELLNNIRVIRKQKGISQESIAYDLGVDYSTYGKVERGDIELTVVRMEKIALILDVPMSDFYPSFKQASINQ